ncbi:major capsid protein [Undibacterium sp. Di26W]|uniref:major capsid protein n=1 Tax=Undibacterium sp. Di26W TaxID=3413035 RepID=UPI003BF0BF87
MATIDIFNNDAFNVISLTGTINDTKYKPERLGELGWFDEKGINTLSFWIERKGNQLALIPNTPRGAPGIVNPINRSKGILFGVTHLPQTDAIMADQIAGVRAFGTESELQTMQGVVNERLQTMRDNIDVTLEYHRIGALKGVILDADGSTVIEDLYNRFNLTQQTKAMALTNGATDVKQKTIEATRLIDEALGAVRYTSRRALCSPSFLDKLVANKAVKADFDRFNNGSFQRDDYRTGFPYAGVYWEEYRGGVGGQLFIPDGKAYLVPEGVAGMFQTKFGFANYMETINTVGLPYYARQEAMAMGKGINLEAQSNPFCINTRPDCVIELTA